MAARAWRSPQHEDHRSPWSRLQQLQAARSRGPRGGRDRRRRGRDPARSPTTREIMSYGIMSTPGLVIDGRVVSYGRIPSAGDIAAWLDRVTGVASRRMIAAALPPGAPQPLDARLREPRDRRRARGSATGSPASTKTNAGTLGGLTTAAVFLIIYPMMVNVRFEALLRAGRNLRGIGIALALQLRLGAARRLGPRDDLPVRPAARARLPARHGRALLEHGHRLHRARQGRPRARDGRRRAELRAGHRRRPALDDALREPLRDRGADRRPDQLDPHRPRRPDGARLRHPAGAPALAGLGAVRRDRHRSSRPSRCSACTRSSS